MLNQNLLFKLLSSDSKARLELSSNKIFNTIINKLNKKSIVLDIGANIGNVSNYILEKTNTTIFAFEPNRLCFEIMVRRFVDNERIKTYNLAVSNYKGTSKLYLHKKSKGINDFNYIESSSLKNQKDNLSKDNKVMINVINISEVLSKFNEIDLIKIDVEGSEYEILPTLIAEKHKIKNVLCEFHGGYNKNNKNQMTNIKNRYFTKSYLDIINYLKKNNLYNNWLYEWF